MEEPKAKKDKDRRNKGWELGLPVRLGLLRKEQGDLQSISPEPCVQRPEGYRPSVRKQVRLPEAQGKPARGARCSKAERGFLQSPRARDLEAGIQDVRKCRGLGKCPRLSEESPEGPRPRSVVSATGTRAAS